MFYGAGEASRKCGINASEIYACLRRKKKTACGYNWKYYEELS